MTMRDCGTVAALLLATALSGCNSGIGMPGTGQGGSGDDSALVSAVAGKAIESAGRVGGPAGFGGTLMEGYLFHAGPNMGFLTVSDLATSNGTVTVHCWNRWTESCTFHLAYLASYDGLDEQETDIEVPAGQALTVELPCAEMMGLGSLTDVGTTGCHLGGGLGVGNWMTVPGFLGLDYGCGAAEPYELTLQPDVDDWDGDGDVTEPVLTSQAMLLHLEDGGPRGHRHGSGHGMMRPHHGAPMMMGGL